MPKVSATAHNYDATMHLVVVSDSERFGGAAVAADRFVRDVRGVVRVSRLVNSPAVDPSPVVRKTVTQPQVVARLGSRILADGWRTIAQRAATRQFRRAFARLRPDIINLHNLHDAEWAGWGPEVVSTCAETAATVWTLHDMWSFTGGCAYSFGCTRFVTGCDNKCSCPNEWPKPPATQLEKRWEERAQLVAKHPSLVAVAPSEWLATQARLGVWRQHRVDVIPYAIPLHIYKPKSRDLARASLGIDTKRMVLMASAMDLAERRKGGDFLVDAMKHLRDLDVDLITVGKSRLPVTVKGTNYHLGVVKTEAELVNAYNSADVFIHPAIVDNLPNVVLEAIACGTPVVAFPVGGVPEMVRPGQTGWLAEQTTSAALAEAILDAAENVRQGVDLRSACRAISDSEYAPHVQRDRYLRLFFELTGRRIH